MALPAALRDLPGDLLPQGLAGARSEERAVAAVLFEERRSENVAYCRTMTGLYALHRVMYADDEAAYLARPGEYAEAVEARRRLAAAEEALDAQVSTLLRMGSAAARHAVETAIGLVERVPKVFGLVGENVISPKAAEAALCRARALGAEQVREYDTALHERLTRELEVVSLPALREAADAIVDRLDHEAAERRRKLAERDRRVTFRPDEDGMGAVFALLPAHDQRELSARLDHIVTTVCDGDPRTVPQRRADGLMQLSRGYGTLGCQCETEDCRYREAVFFGEPDADGAVTRFVTLFHVVLNERDVPEAAEAESAAERCADTAAGDVDGAAGAEPAAVADAGAAATASTGTVASMVEHTGSAASGEQPAAGYLVGHGPISVEYARELAQRPDAKVRPFGRRITDEVVPAAGSDSPESGTATTHVGPLGTLDIAFAFAEIVLHLEHSGEFADDSAGFAWPVPEPGGGSSFDHSDGDDPDAHAPDGGDDDPDDDDLDDGDPGDDDPDDDDPDDGDPDDDPDSGPGGGGGGPPGPLPNPGGDSGGAAPRADAPSPAAPSTAPVVRARGSRGYRPSVDLDRYLRLTIPRCVFPYCNRPASRAQLDHSREFDHRAPELGGRTTADCLQPLCIAHHHVKTAGRWIDARLRDGRILWTSPDGRRYIVDPSSTVLALFPDLARVEWIVPDGVGTGNADPGADTVQSGGRTRLQREHARRERLRQRNIAAVEDEIARAREPRSIVEDRIDQVLGAPTAPGAHRALPQDEQPPF